MVEGQTGVAGMDSLHPREAAWDSDGVRVTTVGTLDLVAVGHRLHPSLSFRPPPVGFEPARRRTA